VDQQSYDPLPAFIVRADSSQIVAEKRRYTIIGGTAMSMNAIFVQISVTELTWIRSHPAAAEGLFVDAPAMPRVLARLTKTVQAAGPQQISEALGRLDPSLRERLFERLGPSGATPDGGAEAIGKLLEFRASRAAEASAATVNRPKLSLDKAWHGVHYVLCGQAEPGSALLSRPVLGGTDLGEDGEGFSGYGPARYFTPAEVSTLSEALSRPGLEAEAAQRFDARRMSALDIYPDWESSDSEWVMDAFRRLRDFYAEAAANGRAIVTCLV